MPVSPPRGNGTRRKVAWLNGDRNEKRLKTHRGPAAPGANRLDRGFSGRGRRVGRPVAAERGDAAHRPGGAGGPVAGVLCAGGQSGRAIGLGRGGRGGG